MARFNLLGFKHLKTKWGWVSNIGGEPLGVEVDWAEELPRVKRNPLEG